MNLKDLRNEIIKDNDDTVSNAELTGWINRGLDDLSMVARYTKQTTYTVVAGQTDYVLPADFLEVVVMNCGIANLPRLALNDFTSHGYKVLGGSLKFQPAPTNGPITMVYIANLPHLETDLDVPAIPLPFHDLLVLFTLTKTKFVDEITDMQSIALGEYQTRKQDFIRYVNRTQSVPTKMRNVGGFYE